MILTMDMGNTNMYRWYVTKNRLYLEERITTIHSSYQYRICLLIKEHFDLHMLDKSQLKRSILYTSAVPPLHYPYT